MGQATEWASDDHGFADPERIILNAVCAACREGLIAHDDAFPMEAYDPTPAQMLAAEVTLWEMVARGKPQAEVAATLRRDFLVTEERADKLSGAWGRHPLLGRMYLPAYRSGTEKVAQLRRTYPPEHVLPALYGCCGLVDSETIDLVLKQGKMPA